MKQRGIWKTRYGFYLAAVGSAVGLGNLWRFPYVVGENGGGAFVLLYLLIALLIGLPLLISELLLGKSFRGSILSTAILLGERSGMKTRWVGLLSMFLSLAVFSYYAVISGWVLYFFVRFLVGYSETAMTTLQSNGWLQLGLACVHILFAVIVVLRGLEDGVERFVGAMTPIFTLLLLFLILKSLALPSAGDAMRFLFYPDFSKLNYSSLAQAIGHVLFTLSIGFGTLVTFGSYLNDSENVATAGLRVTILDIVLSLLSGLLIFPIAMLVSDIRLSSPSLLFASLPSFLSKTMAGGIFGAAFFLCLYLAALGSSISLLEGMVSNMMDFRKTPRGPVTWTVGFLALVLAALPALSGSVFRQMGLAGRGLLETADTAVINWLLPLGALGISILVGRALSSEEVRAHFVEEKNIESVILFPHWIFVIRYIVPTIILVALLLQAIDLWI